MKSPELEICVLEVALARLEVFHFSTESDIFFVKMLLWTDFEERFKLPGELAQLFPWRTARPRFHKGTPMSWAAAESADLQVTNLADGR